MDDAWLETLNLMKYYQPNDRINIEFAKAFARAAHYCNAEQREQGYFDEHVMSVYDKVCSFKGLVSEYTKIAALLHDVGEDCKEFVSFEEIEMLFGRTVKHLVWCLTDEDSENRKIRKVNTYWKIRDDQNATLIKLCDRWANVTKSIDTKSKHGDMYAKEYYTFKCALYHPAYYASLWDELDSLHTQLKGKNIWL